MWTDLRFAIRTLRRTPGFAVLSILSLALGIGATTSVFSLLYQVVLRSVPVSDPSSLVNLESDSFHEGWTRSDNNGAVFSFPLYRELNSRNQVLSSLAGRSGFPATLTDHGAVARTMAEVVTGNYFDVLRLKPALGRLLAPYDDQLHQPGHSIVLSYPYWIGALGGDPGVLKRSILVNGHPVSVVGVAPRNFRGFVSGNSVDFFAPVSMLPLIYDDPSLIDHASSNWLNLFGRIKPDVSSQQAAASLTALYHSVLASQLPQFEKISQAAAKHLLEKPILITPAAQGLNELRSQWQAPLVVLMVMVSIVLLIACANVANLFIARSAFRMRETAVRIAIGAARRQLVRQLLVESTLLSLIGGALGVLAAKSLIDGLLAIMPENATGGWLTDQIDNRVLLFSALASILTGLLFGLAPALQFARTDLNSTLKEQSNSVSAAFAQSRLRWLLVAGQVSLSLLLLVGAGLFTRSLINLLRTNPGFQPEHVITFSLDPSLNGYPSQRREALYRDTLDKLEHLPGVASASAAVVGPFQQNTWGTGVKPLNSTSPSDRDIDVQENAVSPRYFETLGIPISSGRAFTSADRMSAPPVAILSETLAHQMFQNADPLHSHLKIGPKDSEIEVVGIVRDFKFNSLREKPQRFVYIPKDQVTDEFLRQATFLVRTHSDGRASMTSIRRVVKEIDPNVPIDGLISLPVLIGNSVYTDRLLAILAIAFCILAVTLAAIGLYGTISYFVTQRTREFGIRLALGATRSHIGTVILREIAILAGAGAAVGLPLSFFLARLVESQLYGITASDPIVFTAALGLVAASSLFAAAVPLLRAVRIQPLAVLRYE